MPARIDDSTRRNGIGRCVETQAAPHDVSASAMVARVPVANKAVELTNPGRASRLLRISVAAANRIASPTARIAKGIERSRWAIRASSAINKASGVNTPDADQISETSALVLRP